MTEKPCPNCEDPTNLVIEIRTIILSGQELADFCPLCNQTLRIEEANIVRVDPIVPYEGNA